MKRTSNIRFWVNMLLGAVLLVLMLAIILPPQPTGLKKAVANAMVQQCHGLALALFQYATDHDGKYPDGKSSTEVFQKLMPEYLDRSASVYFPMPGKTMPVDGLPLKPENVCFDLTGGVSGSSPKLLPVIFSTGYKVSYTSGGTAISLINPYPIYGRAEHRNWLNGLFDFSPRERDVGIAIGFKDFISAFLPPSTSGSSDRAICNFIPGGLDLQGRSYRQLTPDGSIP